MTFKPPTPFGRKRKPGGRRLPGQSADQDDFPAIRYRVTTPAIIDDVELLKVGRVSAGDYIEISSAGVKFFSDGKEKIFLDNDGDVFIATDVTKPAETYFVLFANNQSYNDESFEAGDLLLGDNSANMANLHWDKSSGRLNFRGGSAARLYLDTQGRLTAGAGGEVILDDAGLSLAAGLETPNKVKFVSGGTAIGELLTNLETAVHTILQLIGRGKDAATHEGRLELVAVTDDGAAHAGAAAVSLALDTALDEALVAAGEFKVAGSLTVNDAGAAAAELRVEGDAASHLLFARASVDCVGVNQPLPNGQASLDVGGAKAMIVPRLTTGQRDALTPAAGMLIFNTSLAAFQGYDGSNWVNL
ncbi:MAG: hypothetical protein ACRDHL_06370 [Candidatus Promineifilaceae bacterium]